jgi:DeoR/GlpR family transcriptional regulator of sugar metabolism
MKTANREKALTALLESATITEAAKKCELSEKTLRRYLDDADFQTEFRAARRVVFEQNIVRLQSLHAGAVDTLERNLTCENPSVEVRAAQIIIEGNRKDFETLDILERLEKIEDEHQKQIEAAAKPNNRSRF